MILGPRIRPILSISLLLLLCACSNHDEGSSSISSGTNNETPGTTDNNALSFTLSWQAPTEKVDGSPLAELAQYRIYYGTSLDDLSSVVDLDDTALSEYTVSVDAAGTYSVAISAISASGDESTLSDIMSVEVSE